MGFLGLRIDLKALRTAINELRHVIQDSDASRAAREAERGGDRISGPVPVVVSYDKQTNESQDRLTRWTKRAAIAAGIYALIAVFQLWEMRKVTKTTAKELELSERPWMSIDKFTVQSPLTFDKNESALITFGFEMNNTGRSPAIRGFWQQDIFLQFLEAPSPVRKRDDACKFAAGRSTKVTDQRITETWFPGEPMPKSLRVGFGPDDIANALKIPMQNFPNISDMPQAHAIYPDFVICVAYRSAFTDSQYHTGYILDLHKTTPKSPYIFPMKDAEIPASDLGLSVHPFYGIDTENDGGR